MQGKIFNTYCLLICFCHAETGVKGIIISQICSLKGNGEERYRKMSFFASRDSTPTGPELAGDDKNTVCFIHISQCMGHTRSSDGKSEFPAISTMSVLTQFPYSLCLFPDTGSAASIYLDLI